MWTVTIVGGDIDSKITVTSLDDIEIIRAMLDQMQRRLERVAVIAEAVEESQ